MSEPRWVVVTLSGGQHVVVDQRMAWGTEIAEGGDLEPLQELVDAANKGAES